MDVETKFSIDVYNLVFYPGHVNVSVMLKLQSKILELMKGLENEYENKN